jgi:hypothetical protein
MDHTAAAVRIPMLYRFELRGRYQRHTWKRKCLAEVAVAFAIDEAREYAKTEAYRGLAIRVIDERGNEVTRVLLPDAAESLKAISEKSYFRPILKSAL